MDRAVVLVVRANSHVVKAAVVSDTRDPDLHWTLRHLNTCIVLLALIYRTLRHGICLLVANYSTTDGLASLFVAR